MFDKMVFESSLQSITHKLYIRDLLCKRSTIPTESRQTLVTVGFFYLLGVCAVSIIKRTWLRLF